MRYAGPHGLHNATKVPSDMGCGVEETCPALKADVDWGLEDPVGQGLDVYRIIRDQIKELVQTLETTMFHTHD